jgi:tetratricopeptide (TPR) repeat protein
LIRNAALLIILGLLATACGSNPPVRPDEQIAATQSNQRGQAAFRSGDYAAALVQHQRALALNRSIENVAGIGDELINLSSIYQRLGQRENARQALDQILQPTGIPFAAPHQAEAAYRMAVFAVDEGNSLQAAKWLNRAADFCQPGDCPASGRIANLKARLELADGNVAAAMNQARRALSENQKRDDKIEQANSLRLLADAAAVSGDCASAGTFYNDALILDKASGAAAKIALDLAGLGRCRARLGQPRAAQDYFRRAYSVSEGIGDTRAMQEILEELKKLSL